MRHNIRDSKGRFVSACKEPEKVYMRGYKGFDKGLICRGKQYKVGEVFEEPEAILCERGIHFCKSLTEVFRYYSPATSEYCEVEALAPVIEGWNKCVTTKLRIVRQLSLQELIEEDKKYCKERVKGRHRREDYSIASVDEGFSTTSNTGFRSIASATSDYSTASTTGISSRASTAGHLSAASATGDCSKVSCSAIRSIASSTGYNSIVSTTEDYSIASAVGNWSNVHSAGDYSIASNTAGAKSSVAVTGKHSVAVNIGCDGKVKGALGCLLVALDIKNARWVTAVVDGTDIKPNVWYKANHGRFVEAE